MKKLVLVLLLLTGCASFQLSTLNHDPVYTIEGSDVEVNLINNEFQLNRLLRKDFKFRWNFAQYAMSQPYGWYMSNYSFSRWRPYNTFDIYWNSTQYWTDWAFNYPFQSSYYGWNRPFNWGYSQYSWYNGPWSNQGYNVVWNRSQRNNVSYHNDRRRSSNIENNIIVNNSNRTRVVTNNNIDIEELAVKLRNKLPNKNIRVYNNPNNPNINNNSKPRIYVRPNNNNINNNTPRINTRVVTSRPIINQVIKNKKNN